MADLVQNILVRFQDFDHNVDGDPAIASLSYLNFESPLEEIPQNGRLVLVLVEPRLLDPLPGAEDLTPVLLRYKGDLRAEGLFSRFIRADVYHGARHQDGRTLLAMRSFLREVRLSFPNFAGVILIGAFPEAPIVRRCIWKINFGGIPIGGVPSQGEFYLSVWPILIATRAEIVLADLTGNWQNLYHEEAEQVESIAARPDAATAATAWPVDGAVFSSTSYSRSVETFSDFFLIEDDDYTVLSAEPGPLQMFVRRQLRHPELSAADRCQPNPIARPDIMVSRINARHVAVNPDPAIHGDNGVTPLDAAGFPQAFTSAQTLDTWLAFYKPDPIFERHLLGDYFDRNHRFRTGGFDDLPFRAAAIASPDFNAQTGAGFLAPASAQFAPPVVASQATVLDYVKWFKQPAVLRHIIAHSSAFNSVFGDLYDPNTLDQEVGGRPFRWRHSGNDYTPTLHDQGVYADFYVHRSMWQNGVMSGTGANLIIHGGCDVESPGNPTLAFSNPDFGTSFQNAEGLLFYMNGLALLSRAKVYNDDPTGFPGAFALATRANFGDGWKAFYDNDSTDAALGSFDNSIGSKKAYFWSMIGDWTARLRYHNGLGILALESALHADHVHADQAWMDGWNFSTAVNTIRGIGDIDGDATSEFVLTSDWGIGILKHDGHRWRQVIVAPNDTWFGGWRYNASVNAGKDRIQGVGRFTDPAKDGILLMSSWGIGVLAQASPTLTSAVCQPNGTRFGGWLFDSRANQIPAFGDMNGDGLDEVVIVSDWGIGILRAFGNTFDSLMLAATGTRLGGWVFNPHNDKIHAVADLDGDGQKEILISSAWGIGVLKLVNGQLTSIAMHANGSNLNGYTLNTKLSPIAAVGDFTGEHLSSILMADNLGIHLLKLCGGSLRQVSSLANGQGTGGWVLNTHDNTFGPVGDLNGDGRDEFIVRSAWGIGVLEADQQSFQCPALQACGSRLGGWILEQKDRLAGIANFSGGAARKELLVQKGV